MARVGAARAWQVALESGTSPGRLNSLPGNLMTVQAGSWSGCEQTIAEREDFVNFATARHAVGRGSVSADHASEST